MRQGSIFHMLLLIQIFPWNPSLLTSNIAGTSKKIISRKLFLGGIEVYIFPKKQIHKPKAGYILDVHGGSPDINSGFVGNFVYLFPIWTDTLTKAITQIQVIIQTNANKNFKDMASGAGGEYRYLDFSNQSLTGFIISDIVLWRSNKNDSKPDSEGWQYWTRNINDGRGKDFLYLCWNLTAAPNNTAKELSETRGLYLDDIEIQQSVVPLYLEATISEVKGRSANINEETNRGLYMYFIPVWTNQVNNSATSISYLEQKEKSALNFMNMTEEKDSKYRYLKILRNSKFHHRITQLALWRTNYHDWTPGKKGWKYWTDDFNKDFGTNHLYLCWNTTDVRNKTTI